MDAFKEIQGQEKAVEQLKNALGHPVNSYIFYGNRGTFVEESARIFASRLIDPSGALDARIAKQIYTDVIEFEPIGVNYRIKEDVRDSMISELNKSPLEGEKKILIIHDAHHLRADSANALLKSIEEPPENFIWILIAPSRDLVLSTIHSRCFPVSFSLLSNEIIFNHLVSRGINESLAREIANSCGGRLDRALDMATRYRPLVMLARDIASQIIPQGSFVTSSTAKVTELFDEISKDLISEHKTKLDELKKETKDSGYSEKIQKAIVSAAKTRFDAQEKRLRTVLIQEFLDYLQNAMFLTEKDGPHQYSYDIDAINRFRKKLLFNPSENLFLEGLLSTLALSKV